MSETPDSLLSLQPVPETARHEAFECLWQNLDAKARDPLEQAIRKDAATLSGDYWATLVGDSQMGFAWAQRHAGNVATIHGPKGGSGDASAGKRLLDAATQQAFRQGVKIVQALKDPEEALEIQRLQSAGFVHAADLLYMACEEDCFPVQAPVGGLRFESLSDSADPRLARIIQSTYRNSLDCPAVDGVRPLEDVLQGYCATGNFDPQRWLLAVPNLAGHEAEQDIGCLLLNDHPEHDQLELIYMGVAPEFRAKGYGGEIVREALWRARLAGRRRVVLAVDEANNPGVRMYAAAGFYSFARKVLLIRVSGPPA